MKIITSPQEMSRWSGKQRDKGRTVALVPTMGYFHEGHLSLMRKGASVADKVVVSLFVNPTQFGPGEDLDRYPRDFEGDCGLAEKEKVSVLFAPDPESMYPEGFQTSVQVEQITRFLCGVDRPTHFQGVATVVTKLFNIVRPDSAVFGEKDFQQLAVIRRMTVDLNMDVTIIGHPIVREADGLALSSRNSYLGAEARKSALSLSGALALAGKCFREGIVDVDELSHRVRSFIKKHPGTSIDYVSFVNSTTLAPVAKAEPDTVLALAVRIEDKVRLIDNGMLSDDFSSYIQPSQ